MDDNDRVKYGDDEDNQVDYDDSDDDQVKDDIVAGRRAICLNTTTSLVSEIREERTLGERLLNYHHIDDHHFDNHHIEDHHFDNHHIEDHHCLVQVTTESSLGAWSDYIRSWSQSS